MRAKAPTITLAVTAVAAVAVAAAACGGSTSTATVSGAQPGGVTPPAGAPGATPSAGARPSGVPPDFSGFVTAALQPLVDDDTITAGQMQAVQTALVEVAPGTPPQSGTTPSPPGDAMQPQNMFAGALDGLVSDGTLAEDEAEAVSNALADSIRPPPVAGR